MEAYASRDGGGVSARLDYNFLVVAPDQASYDALGLAIASNPVRVSGTARAQTMRGANAYAYIYTDYNAAQGFFLSLEHVGSGCGADSASSPFNVGMNLTAGPAGTLSYAGSLILFAFATTDFDGCNSADACVDPIIALDPNVVANVGNYAIVLPAGIANASGGPVGTPEPAALALLAGALAVLGAARRGGR